MTQDEIIEMAKQAGCIARRHPEYWEDIQVVATPDVIVNFAKLIAEKERLKQRKWVGLTDEEMKELWENKGWYVTMYKAVEAKLKEKNTR